jgi:hypothetical protein
MQKVWNDPDTDYTVPPQVTAFGDTLAALCSAFEMNGLMTREQIAEQLALVAEWFAPEPDPQPFWIV